ncbi:hypothetical protein EAF04_004552 [Stromatinia cepivora]|nr:hypothetical protein EAF04_004552 [Stromatinia cepivora]
MVLCSDRCCSAARSLVSSDGYQRHHQFVASTAYRVPAQLTHRRDLSQPMYDEDRSFTLRAIISGRLIGVFVNISNTYYGLRTGASSQMPMVSGLLGYVGFKIFSKYTMIPFTATENVLIISAATAVGCMPVIAGFTGVVPALEYVVGPEDNGPIRIDWKMLILWSFGLCFFRLIFASLLRELPWPGPRATAHLISKLHHKAHPSSYTYCDNLASTAVTDTNTNNQSTTNNLSPRITQEDDVFEQQPLLSKEDEIDWKARMTALLRGAIASSIATIILYFLPITPRTTNFRIPRSKPVALDGRPFSGVFRSGYNNRYQGWAPGDPDDWETGSRGWTIWISLAALLVDASIKLSWFLIRPLWLNYVVQADLIQWAAIWKKNYQSNPPPLERQYLVVATSIGDDSTTARNVLPQTTEESSTRESFSEDNNSVLESPAPTKILSFSLLVSVITCALVIHLIFGKIIAWYYTILANKVSSRDRL